MPQPIPIHLLFMWTGIRETLTKLTVTLNGFCSHTYPDDVDILLVEALRVKKVMLMSDAGGGNVATNLTLKFDDTVY